MKKKLMIAVPVVLLLGFVAMTMTKPKHTVHMKVAGSIYLLPESFLLNLTDGRYAKFSVALVLSPGQSDGKSATAAAAADSSSGTSLGTLPEEALIRDLIASVVTGQSGDALISSQGRARLKQEMLTAILNRTDVKVKEVLFPDLAVQ